MLFKKRLTNTKVVINYHSVKPAQRDIFENHMNELLKIAQPVPAGMNKTLKSNQHNVALTFDDGYQSVFYYALPTLIKKKIPATIFVTTGYLGKKPGWIHNLAHENANELLMNEEMIKSLPTNLITVGSHCVTHPHLEYIGEDNAVKELVHSKTTLENILNREVKLLALPFGSLNESVLNLAKSAGYELVFWNIPTLPFINNCNFLVGRIDVSLHDWMIEYRLKFLGAYNWLPVAVMIKRTLLRIFTKQDVSYFKFGFRK